jgi:hypothetical protein
MHIQNTSEQLSVNPIGLHKERRILFADSQFGAFFVTLATSWRRQVLLSAHSKCLGNYSMRIQNMAKATLFYHIGA